MISIARTSGVPRRPGKWPHMLTPTRDAGGHITGTSGGMCLSAPFKKVITRHLKREFAQWWVYNVLKPRSEGNKLPQRVKFSEFKGESRFSLPALGFEIIPSFIELEMFSYGYKRSTDGYSLAAPKKTLSSVLRGGQVQLDQVLGVIRELQIKIPDEKDPSVYIIHGGTYQYAATEETKLYEAKSDAACTISYLRAYNELIKRPTVGNLLIATKDPRNTGPYFRTMMVAFNSGISPEFMSLLHTCFQIHFITEGRFERSTSHLDADKYDQIDLWLFRAILKRFCEDNFPHVKET